MFTTIIELRWVDNGLKTYKTKLETVLFPTKDQIINRITNPEAKKRLTDILYLVSLDWNNRNYPRALLKDIPIEDNHSSSIFITNIK